MPFNTYGHFLHDILATLVMYPDDVLNQELYVFHNYNWNDKFKEHLDAMGLTHIHPYDSKINGFVLVHKLYYIHAYENTHEFDHLGLPRVSKYFRSNLKFDQIEPTKYNIINRRPNERRYFTNIKELLNALKVKFPNINFQEIQLQEKLVDTGRLFAETKVLIGSGGSLLFNSMFMHNETGVVCLFANKIDLPDNIVLACFGIYNIGVVHPNINFYEGQGACDIELTVDCVDKIIFAVENKKYPQMKGYYPVIANYSLFFQVRMRNSYNNGAIWNYAEKRIE
ncbi:hypothetical protein TVAG_402280 [Trichomonas vaginalis G3]|uniref:Glycosyltransferase 61 catalytic domain-containing protein n=1 Tax=Trichomonas vaginalis (strain ATCC PRA-98 / G3) TaxID=412133 RepID=A2DHY4_TRIV3|nr:protein of unknown function, DUF563 family [Trichomonas vaginalis G3]EAY19973.1 hypothetical protein TVAG_402280 [Trichomonas vaginalis G3]KAI5525923.1 protein of unknown function, DUF563 family [Trichomonas vaginalis G3]|eukprot:XP_001580959.1 hypothetical protein [Trichomonas vaginalis G3]